MPSEFEIIERYFTHPARRALLGVGDDCALIKAPEGMALAVSTDMLVEGTHFFPGADPALLGHKSLAVNLSDLAAMGATPRWVTLALALPSADEKWLKPFSEGFMALAEKYGVELVGGDTTRGPLNICVQIIGEVPPQLALKRSTAMAGDSIWVSGNLGDAALALKALQHEIELDPAGLEAALRALNRPEPRVELGQALLGVASSAIDISDGLCADLGHIAARSGVAAIIEFERLPCSLVMQKYRAVAADAIVSGGDDYELCFTAPDRKTREIEAIGERLGMRLTRIGRIEAGSGVTLVDGAGCAKPIQRRGYDHFGKEA